MIKHAWTVICSRVVTDSETNNVSLMEVVEEVHLTGRGFQNREPEWVPLQLDLISLWYRLKDTQGGQVRSKLSIMGADSKLIGPPVLSVIDLRERKRLRNITRFGGLPLKGPGRVTFELAVEKTADTWEIVANVPLEISFSEVPAAPEMKGDAPAH